MTNSSRILMLAAGIALCVSATTYVAATPLGATRGIERPESVVEQVARFGRGGAARGGMARRSTYVGPRGGVARTTTVRRGGAVVRPGWHGGGVRWTRPGRYWWPAGGAIAAGAAIGVVTAATAAAWAGPPPGPNMCWYYTDPSRRQGFWDVCQ